MKSETKSHALAGELLFAGSREAFHEDRPDRDLITREGLDLSDEVQRAQAALEACEEFGSEELIERARGKLAAARAHLAEWEEEGCSESARLPYFPMAWALSKSEGKLGDPDLDGDEMAARVKTLRVLFRYVFQDGHANPWQGYKNFLAMTRRAAPEFLGGMTQEQVATLLGEGKAAVSDREIREVEDLLIKWKVFGHHLLGGTKSKEARESNAKAAAGNSNRRKGARKAKAKTRKPVAVRGLLERLNAQAPG